MANIEKLNKQRKAKTRYDLTIHIGDKQFVAHRNVLKDRLKFFRDRITPEMERTPKADLILDPELFNSDAFDNVLEYIYASKTEIGDDIKPLCLMAKLLGFEELLRYAEKFMKIECKMHKINLERFMIMYETSVECNMESAEKACIQALSSILRLNTPAKKVFLSELQYENLKVFLEGMNHGCEKEDIFLLCIEWIEIDPEERSCRLPELLESFPLKSVSPEFLIEVVSTNPIVLNDNECLRLLVDALKLNFQIPRSESLFVIGGYLTDSHLDINKYKNDLIDHDTKNSRRIQVNSISKISSSGNKWNMPIAMQDDRDMFACAALGQNIYFSGGMYSKNEKFSRELWKFDTLTRKWKQLKSMNNSRANHSMEGLNGFLYVTGGFGVDNLRADSQTVERYSLQDDKWEQVSPMIIARSRHALKSFDGFLYAIGGCNGEESLKSVERYDPSTGQWSNMADLKHEMYNCSSAVLDNKLYVSNGRDFEVYHSEENIWLQMPSCSVKNFDKIGAQLAAFNGELLVIGDVLIDIDWRINPLRRDGRTTILNPLRRHCDVTFVFDFENDEWKSRPDMTIHRIYHRVVVVKNGDNL